MTDRSTTSGHEPSPPPTDPLTPGGTPRGAARGAPRRRAVRGGLLAAAAAAIAVALPWAIVARRTREAAEGAGAPPARLRRVGAEVAVVLDSVALRRAGIETRALGPANAAGTVRLTGELVADPARVFTLRAAVPGRLSAPRGRWPSLGERVAAGAALAQLSDARPLTAPRAGTVTRVGAQPGEIVQAGQELLQLTDLGAPVARIVWRADAPPPPPVVAVAPLTGGGAGSAARLVGPAAEADSLTRAPVYLYRLAGAWAGARPGMAVVAEVPEAGAGASGLLVPTEAVVQWQGLAWAYVARGPGQFVRVRVDASHPVPGGWLVPPASAPRADAGPDALGAGDRVVVRGAAQLLSEEFRSRLPVGEEDEGG